MNIRRRKTDMVMIFLMASSIPFLHGCSNEEKPKDQPYISKPWQVDPRDEKIRFALGDTDWTIENSLAYACDSGDGRDLNQPEELEMDEASFKSCLKKLTPPLKITNSLVWDCPQSDRSAILRPLPDAQTIDLDVNFRIKNGKLSASLSLQAWEQFLKPSLDGNTNYRFCRNKAINDFSLKIEESLNSWLKSGCGQRPPEDTVFQLVESIEEELLSVNRAYEKRESSSILLDPILPYYTELNTPSGTADNLLLCFPMENTTSGLERDLNARATEILSQDFVDNKLAIMMERGGLECVANTLKFYLPESDSNKKFQACLGNPKKDMCPIILERYKILYAKLNAIKGGALRDFDFSEAMSPNAVNLPGKLKGELEKGSTTCELLPVGAKKRVMNVFPAYGSKLEYQIERVGETKTSLKLNVTFKPSCTSSVFENKVAAKAWLDRANSCLLRAAPHLLGPDGHNVEIQLISESSVNAPASNSITVLNEAKDIRENWRLYSPTTSCGTILHEVLHLLGLVDEYKETEEYYVDEVGGSKTDMNYGCRILGPPDSVMRDQRTSIRDSVMNGSSLLKPAHYRMLMFPGCSEKNRTYLTCSKYAFTPMISGKCLYSEALPDACTNGSYDWINK